MKKSELIAAFTALEERLYAEMLKGSTGYRGKWADAYCRNYMLVRGIGDVADVRCRKAEQVDVRIKVRGVFKDFEIKTGAGGWACPSPNWTEADILPGKDYIAFTCEPALLTRENYPQVIRVFTHEQFVEMLRATGSKGLASSLKYNKSRETLEIQPWATKATDKKTGKERWAFARRNRCYAFIKANEIPTLEEFIEWARG